MSKFAEGTKIISLRLAMTFQTLLKPYRSPFPPFARSLLAFLQNCWYRMMRSLEVGLRSYHEKILPCRSLYHRFGLLPTLLRVQRHRFPTWPHYYGFSQRPFKGHMCLGHYHIQGQPIDWLLVKTEGFTN